jgi:hypothetical protein
MSSAHEAAPGGVGSETPPDGAPVQDAGTSPAAGWAIGGVAAVLVLGGLARYLEQTVPTATKGTAFGEIAAAIEYPVYAVAWYAASAPSSSSRPGSCCSAGRSTSL